MSSAGLVFDESVGLDPTLEQAQAKPKISLREDPKQAQVTESLLTVLIVSLWF